MSKKGIALLISVALILSVAIGGAFAWLQDTGTVTNTFTAGKVGIDLDETERTYKMVPGTDLDKDPVVTVAANSEKSWVFVEVTEENDFGKFARYTAADGWTKGTGEAGDVPANVYYRIAEASTTDQELPVLKDNKVHVLDSVTEDMLKALTKDTYPNLTFTAYACQYFGFTDNPAGAWTEVSAQNK